MVGVEDARRGFSIMRVSLTLIPAIDGRLVFSSALFSQTGLKGVSPVRGPKTV